MEHNPTKIPSPLLSLVPILVLVTLLFVTIRIFGSDALSGGSQIVLLTATAICCLIAMTYSKVRWKVLELAMINNITGVATALIILLIIGALSGSWMISGVVPTLIYYGMQIIHPSFFLASTCIICAVVSVMTGSSWTTIATIGIALLGIGQAQGFSDGWIAGAIISGAYFGGLFRGQDISTFRYDHPCLIGNGHTSFQTYPLHDDHNSSLYVDHARYLHGSRSFTRSDGNRPDRTVLDRPEQYVPYHTVAADRTGRHWHPDCEKSSIDHHAVHFGGIGRHVRADFPATPVAGNFRFTSRKHPIQF